MRPAPSRRRARPRALPLLIGAVLLAGAVESIPAGARKAPPRKNILLISIDTLRADHLGCYGYFRNTSPAIDALAEESVFFELALTPLATTLPAHTSLLTGTHPLEHGVLGNARQGRQFVRAPPLRSFADFARKRGYRTAAFVSAAPVASATGIDEGFELFDEPERRERIAADTNASLLDWLDGAGERPFFVWVHYFDPHTPYAPPEPYDRAFDESPELAAYIAARKIPPELERPNGRKLLPRRAVNRYDGEIRYVDSEVGKLFDRLKALKLWDETLTILLADHGEGLGEHDTAGHGYIHREQIHVPLMIRVPGHPPRRVPTVVSLVDVLPTALGLLRDDGHPAWQPFLQQASGRDVLAAGAPDVPVLTRRSDKGGKDHRTDPVFSLATREWKYVYEPSVANRLFDWIADPLELENLAAANASKAEELEAILLQQAARYAERHDELAGDADVDREMNEELLEKLRALGYVD